jgi:hypothetical protein
MKKGLVGFVVVLVTQFFGSSLVTAQQLPLKFTELKTERGLKVEKVFVLEKGDSCIKALGLSLKECWDLGNKYGVKMELFITPDGTKKYILPVKEGDRIYLLSEYKKGSTEKIARARFYYYSMGNGRPVQNSKAEKS